MAPEVNLRIAAIWAPNIKAEVKLATLHPLVFSKLFYNAGVWPKRLRSRPTFTSLGKVAGPQPLVRPVLGPISELIAARTRHFFI